MLEAAGLVLLILANLALALLADSRTRKLAASDARLYDSIARCATLEHEKSTVAYEKSSLAREKADIEALLQKSLTERADLAGRLATAEDLKASYEQAALLTLARMGAAREVLRRPRLTAETRIRKALACLEPSSKTPPHVTLTTTFRTAEEDARLNALPTMRGKARK